MIYLSKKGREKGRVWIEIQCNISHLAKRKNAWNQRFSSVLIRIECLFNFCEEDVVLKVCNDIWKPWFDSISI